MLRAERHSIVVHEQLRLLFAQLHPEPMHVRTLGLLVQRAWPVL